MKKLLATLIAALALMMTLGPAAAQGRKKKPGSGKTKVEKTDLGGGQSATSETSENAKVKVIDFTGLALSGRIRTPQLLYFLNRIRQELEAVQLEKRSFMPELARSVNDDAL